MASSNNNTVETIQDQGTLVKSIQFFVNNPQHSQEEKQAILSKISTYLQKVLRKAKRKTIESQPDSVLQLLQSLLVCGFTSPLILKSDVGIDLLPYFFNLAQYQSSRIFIPQNSQQYEDGVQQKQPNRYFPSPAYFSLSQTSAKFHLDSPIIHDQNTKLTLAQKKNRINELADRIVCYILLNSKPKNLLFALSDLMLKPVNSSKRVGRILLAFGLLFRLRLLKRKKVSKYLQGSLFVLGGYLKNEAKSYIKCVEDNNLGGISSTSSSSDRVVVQDGENPRKLTSDDLLFFQDGAMLRACQYFVKSVVTMAAKSSYSLYGGLGDKNFDFYSDYTSQMYIEAKYQQYGLPPDPTLKDTIQATHYSLLSLFDMIQYIFEHLTFFKLKGDIKIGYNLAAKNDREQCTKFKANNQAINEPYNTNWKWLDQSDTEQEENKSGFQSNSNLRFPPIMLRKLPGSLKLDWEYNIPGTSELVCTILHGIRRISQAPLDLYSYWLVKNQNEKSQIKTKKNSKLQAQNKDGYSKNENYNNVGIATYYSLMLIFQERHSASIEQILGKQLKPKFQDFGMKTGIKIGSTFPIPIAHELKLKIMLSLLEKLVTQTLQKPKFFYNLAFVTLERVFLPFLIEGQQIPLMEPQSQGNLKEILIKLLMTMGSAQQDSNPEQAEQIGKSMALLLKKILSKLQPKSAIKLYYQLMLECNNQNACGYIIDCLRIDCGNRNLYGQDTRLAFSTILLFALQIKTNYQDEFERIYAGITLLKYLSIQKGKIGMNPSDFLQLKQKRLKRIQDQLSQFMSQESKSEQDAKIAAQIQKIPKDVLQKLKMMSEMVKNISISG